MRCNNCGTENNNGVKYCTSCGKKLKKKSNNTSKKKLHVSLCILITVFVLIVATVFLNFFSILRIPFLTKFTSLYLNIDKEIGENSLYQPDVNHVSVDTQSNIMYIDNVIIVFFKDDVTEIEIQNAINIVDGKIIGSLPIVKQYQVQVTESSLLQLESLCNQLMKSEVVDYATYDGVLVNSDQVEPNDPGKKDAFSEKQDWNEATPTGNNWWAEAVYAPSAWKYNDRMQKISIGVLDGGVDYEHEELKNKVKFISPVNDKDDHGTHVCGIIAAEANNKKGITGLLWNADLLTWDIHLTDSDYKILKDNNETWSTESQMYGGLVVLVQKGAKVVNLSQGKGESDSTSEEFVSREGRLASQYMYMMLKNQYDFVVIQSSGNGNSNHISVDAIYNGGFCSINKDNCRHDDTVTIDDIINRVIVVGAAKNDWGNSYTQRSTSNAGDRVDICAPGEDVFSTVPGDVVWAFEFSGGYGEMSGTSMAAPIVSGIAGMVWAVNPSLSGNQVKQIVCARENTYYDVADNKERNHPLDNTYRLVNAQLAVEAAIEYDRNKPFVVEIDDNNVYKAGNYLIENNGKIFCAKSDGIYYKENVTSEAKKISNTGNVISLLSDGETVYYVEGYDDCTDIDKRFTSKKIYKTSINDSKSEYIFSSNGQADLITCQNGCLYYIDITKSGNEYKYSLMKHKIGASDSTKLVGEWSADLPSYWKDTAYCLGNTIFLTVNKSLCSYNIGDDKYNELISASDGSICDIIDNKVCFRYSKGESYYIAMIDANSNVETSVPISKKYDYQIVAQSGEYALFSSTMSSGEYNLYTIDLKTGKIDVSEGDAGGFLGKNYFVAHDLVKPENLYFMYGVRLYDENSKSLKQMKSDDFEINITKPMWIIDSYIVDWNLNTYKIYDDTVDSLNTNKNILSQNESWKTLYIDHINSMNKVYEDIYIAYIDDDDIPELYVRGKYHMAGAALCWIDDGEVKFQACAQNFGFKEKSGKCYAYTMQMGVSLLTEYTLSDGKLTEKKIASCSENNDTYTWDGNDVSKDDFWTKHQSYINNYTTPDYTEYTSREDFATTIESY